MTGTLVNRVFAQLQIGDRADLTRTVQHDDIMLFAALSGDNNPAHLDAAFAADGPFGHVVAHGMWTAGLVSAVLGTRLPGPGTIYLGQEIRFRKPVAPGDTITATVEVVELIADKKQVRLAATCTNQRGEMVLEGDALVIAPTTAVTGNPAPCPRPSSITPAATGALSNRHGRCHRLRPASCIPARKPRSSARSRSATRA
ncbi:MAG: MaoC/PaaZ C-terminal domain-containing protein [Roseovarius sp.]|nr:MaoC/PaaZ C-terminal domain-containing protein [Roseovarius sp.]